MRRLGVDPGARRIGLAVSDEEARFASPHRTVARRPSDPKAAVSAVAAEVESLGVVEVVLGLPLTMDGVEGTAARRARAFGTRLEAAVEVPVVYWDERLTTAQAERALTEAGVKAKDQKDVVDQVAASILLQSYLDALQHRRAREAGEEREGESGWPNVDPDVGPAPDRGARRSRRGGGRRSR